MKKFMTSTITFFLCLNILAVDYTLECSSQDRDFFVVTFMDEDSELRITEANIAGTSVDDYIVDASFSENYQIIKGQASFYDYFTGEVEFFLGQGLLSKRVGEDFAIALSLDDGDGFGFHKKRFSCLMTRISL